MFLFETIPNGQILPCFDFIFTEKQTKLTVWNQVWLNLLTQETNTGQGQNDL